MSEMDGGRIASSAAETVTGGVVGNEFAEVEVEVDHTANGPRLRLRDLRSGRTRYVDALELETIVWLPDEHLQQLLDPSANRWREDVR